MTLRNRVGLFMTWVLAAATAVGAAIVTVQFVPAPPVVPSHIGPSPVDSPSSDRRAWEPTNALRADRNSASPEFSRLHAANWDRTQPLPLESRDNRNWGHSPTPPPPTEAAARAALNEQARLVMVWSPNYALIVLRTSPEETITVISVAEFSRQLAERRRFAPSFQPDPTSHNNVCDLAALGCPVRVLDIQPAGLHVAYTLRGQTFEFDWMRESNPVAPFPSSASASNQSSGASSTDPRPADGSEWRRALNAPAHSE